MMKVFPRHSSKMERTRNILFSLSETNPTTWQPYFSSALVIEAFAKSAQNGASFVTSPTSTASWKKVCPGMWRHEAMMGSRWIFDHPS